MIGLFLLPCRPEDVEKALEVSKDKHFFGCKIEVTAHEGLDAEDNEFRPLEAELDEYHPKATRTLFIGNLEKDITTAELRKHFDQFGEIIVSLSFSCSDVKIALPLLQYFKSLHKTLKDLLN